MTNGAVIQASAEIATAISKVIDSILLVCSIFPFFPSSVPIRERIGMVVVANELVMIIEKRAIAD